MSVDILVWLLSLGEAALFFAGGVLFAFYRTAGAGARTTAASARGDAAQAALAEQLVSADVLRAILDRETRDRPVAGAVIADELGLVVAGKGTLCDVLAAYGAVLAGMGAKTREVLPLREIRKVVIEDACDMTLTVRPIATASDRYALVTLTCAEQGVMPRAGAAPEGEARVHAR